ncbi:sap61 [Candida oxycetoniae]|uniref:Sap61 n=1 Tax=Candida oxycetoniae TaxID=497107 RepID=A0AAI9WWE7_9ASCO|nr:sap61 [Candida oxycetoniae]KAI3402664.2 sap61 [Candida oxycetoniae]
MESKRALLQEANTIEDAITKRLLRYNNILNKCTKVHLTPQPMDFSAFDEAITKIPQSSDIAPDQRRPYMMFRGALGKQPRKNVLCQEADHIKPVEIDLRPFHQWYIQITGDNIAYRDFLGKMAITDNAMVEKLRDHAYTQSLTTHLLSIYALLKPLEKLPIRYCCGRSFTNENVFKAHLGGKKHKRGNSQQAKPVANWDVIDCALTSAEYNSDDSSKSESESEPELDPSMPRWLYKLQGLHKSYQCEICGNTTYTGSKAFSAHFAGARHLQGLHALGVSDTRKFNGITAIADVQQLNASITSMNKSHYIEVEDEHGHVLAEADYIELKKQGL